jgi:hypothetical protein
MNDRYTFSLVIIGLVVFIFVLTIVVRRLQRRSLRRTNEECRIAAERDAKEQARIELFSNKLAPPGGVTLKSVIEPLKYQPVFAGVVDNSDPDRGDIPVVVYKHRNTGQYYLEYNRGDDLYPMTEGTKVTVWDDQIREEVHMKVENSATWNGTATGTWRDLRLVNAR